MTEHNHVYGTARVVEGPSHVDEEFQVCLICGLPPGSTDATGTP